MCNGLYQEVMLLFVLYSLISTFNRECSKVFCSGSSGISTLFPFTFKQTTKAVTVNFAKCRGFNHLFSRALSSMCFFTSVKNEEQKFCPGQCCQESIHQAKALSSVPEILVGSREGAPPESFSKSKFNLRCRSAKPTSFSVKTETM